MSQFKLFLLVLIAINFQSGSSNGQKELKKSLVIVLDVTTSMADKIEILRINAKKLLGIVHSWRGRYIENYMLVQFGDEEINSEIIEPIINSNYVNVKNSLDTVKIIRHNETETCMASCYQGLKRGLELANDDSIFLVFTDAGTKHKELLPTIKDLTRQKRITYYFTLLKECPGYNAVADYHELVSLYNGDVYNVDDSNIEKHFQILIQILTGPPSGPDIEVIVDSTMSEFILTITGLNAIITIFDPKQNYVPSTRYKLITNLPTIKMIKVPDPIPGRYTIEIFSETSYTGQVQTKSDLKFDYGFAVNEPSSIFQINYAPMIGHNTYLAVLPSNASLVSTLEYVELFNNDNERYTYKLHSKPHTNLFLTDSFPSPSKSFKINVHGRDRFNNRILRLISTSISADSARKPTIDVARKITVQEGDPIYLICRVRSMVNVTTWLSKIGSKSLPTLYEFQQSDLLNYTIDYSLISDSGEYVCTAENSIGASESKTIVMVKQTALVVQTPMKSIETEEGTRKLVIKCNVTPNSKYVKVLWLFNGEPKIPQDAQYNKFNLILTNIDRNFKGLYTCVGQKGAEQKRDSTQLIVMYPPNITHLFNLKTNSPINIAESLKLSNISTVGINCVYESFPQPTVQWIGPTGSIISNTSILNLLNSHETGEYSCRVENQMGKTEKKIKIIMTGGQTNEFESDITDISTEAPLNVSFGPSTTVKHITKPMVKQNYNKTIELIEGNSFTLSCPIEADEYNVTWLLNEKNLNNLKLSDDSIYIDSVNATMTGALLCIGSNSAGTVNVTFTFDMQRQPYDLVADTSTGKSPVLNQPYGITCNAKGWPEPTMYWVKDENYLRHGNSIYFDKLGSSDSGTYTCIAVNNLGIANKTFILNGVDPMINSLSRPYDINVKPSKWGDPIINQPYHIKCFAKGNPKPEIKWIKDGKLFKQDSTIKFARFQQENSGEYTCVARNENGDAMKTFVLRLKGSFLSSAGNTSHDGTSKLDSNSTYFIYITDPNNTDNLGPTSLIFILSK